MHSMEIITLVKKLSAEGKSYRAIHASLQLPISTIQYIVKNNYHRPKPNVGRPTVVSRFHRVSIKREISKIQKLKERVTSRKIKKYCNLQFSKSIIQRALQRLGFNYKKAQKSIVLTKTHKENRVKICTNWICDRVNWKNVIFSDEKSSISTARTHGSPIKPRTSPCCAVNVSKVEEVSCIGA